MRVEFWGFPNHLAGPGSLWGWAWTMAGFLIVFGLWIRRPDDLRSWKELQASEVRGLLLLILLTSLSPILSWNDFPGLPFRVGFPLFFWLPYLVWGGRLQPGALALAGLVGGALIGFTSDGRFLHLPWIIALDVTAIGSLLAQNYVGRLFRALRQPVSAAIVGWGIWLILQAISWGSFYPSWPEAVDGIWTLYATIAPSSGVSALLCGLIAQGLHWRWPSVFLTRRPPQWPPHAREIRTRMRLFFGSWMGVLILSLSLFMADRTVRQAYAERMEAVNQGVRRAGEQLLYFLHTGDTLLADLAALGIPQSEDPRVVAPILQRFVQTGPIYHTVLLTGADGEILVAYPVEERARGLSTEEHTALTQARTARSTIHTKVHRLPDGTAGLSFITPLDGEPPRGFLIGRARIAKHPAMQEVLTSLRVGVPSGEGLLIDPQGQILLHADPQRILDVFPLPVPTLSGPLDVTQRSSIGTNDFLHFRRLPGTDWWAVIRYPRSALIRRVLELILPAIGILVGFAVGGMLLLNILSWSITRRLRQRTVEAARMAEGELEVPIEIEGPDEVGLLAEAMERMRHGLRARLMDLSLLLELNQRLVETGDLAHGLPEVARSLERATQASEARVLIPGTQDSIRVFTTIGEKDPEPLDEACWSLGLERGEPLWIDHVLRHPDLPAVLSQEGGRRALAILPIRLGEELLGVAWLTFTQPHRVPETERQLIRLILSQTAVFIARARLYEAALAERERLRAVLESSPDVLMLIDVHGHLLYLNPTAERFLGLPALRAIGQPIAPLLKDPELGELLNERIPPGHVRSREFKRSDGRVYWAGRYDLRLGDGREIGQLVFVRDITPFRALDELKSDFIAAISHDLRSPLTYMRGFVTMLGMAGPLTARQQEYVEKIMDGIDQMARLIEDLMDLKRIEEGIGQRGICRLSDLIQDVFHEMRPHAMARGLRMTLEVKGQGIANGDPAWLRRAITNLIDNAIKYTPTGGIISLGLREQDKEIVIWVKDSGIGIAPADQARIFEKFYRVRRKETAHVKGSGLGLALVKSIVEWHGGRIWVKSQLGQGSTFYLAIPKATIATPSSHT